MRECNKGCKKLKEDNYDVVVVGAGIAGVATAYALVNAGAGRVAILDDGPPLGMTSDKSTECFRNFWPGTDSAMLDLVGTSISRLMQLADISNDRFQLRQQGYLFATARPEELEELARQAAAVEKFGGGPLRIHDGTPGISTYQRMAADSPNPDRKGADLITDQALIQSYFPYLANETIGLLHVRQCGALSAQQLGMYLLDEARANGTTLHKSKFEGIETSAGHLSHVNCLNADGPFQIKTSALVLATGPHLKSTAKKAGTVVPVEVEKHVKISMSDRLGIIPRDAPLIIWNDPIDLPWSKDEHEMLAASPETHRLTETFPAGVHGRPFGGGDQVLMYWTYDCEVSEHPTFPIEPNPYLPEITLRGMATMVPGLTAYLDPMPKPYVDGGYYTKAPDNRPLIGPMSVPGTYICGAFSGYGIMAACAAGEVTAAHVLSKQQPAWAGAFKISRFEDPNYLSTVSNLAAAQL